MAATGLSYQAWRAQRHAAKQRGIEFLFTYAEWHAWWMGALAARGDGAERGLGKSKLSMCRIGDKGPYASWNVYPGTPKENRAHGAPPRRGYISWLRGTTGADHPRSRSIITKDGQFPSMQAAADHYGVSRTEIRRRIADGKL